MAAAYTDSPTSVPPANPDGSILCERESPKTAGE